jgi:hypothetical protein
VSFDLPYDSLLDKSFINSFAKGLLHKTKTIISRSDVKNVYLNIYIYGNAYLLKIVIDLKLHLYIANSVPMGT